MKSVFRKAFGFVLFFNKLRSRVDLESQNSFQEADESAKSRELSGLRRPKAAAQAARVDCVSCVHDARTPPLSLGLSGSTFLLLEIPALGGLPSSKLALRTTCSAFERQSLHSLGKDFNIAPVQQIGRHYLRTPSVGGRNAI